MHQNRLVPPWFSQLKVDTNRWGWMRSLLNRVINRVAHGLGVYIHVVRTHMVDEHPKYPAIPPELVLRQISTQELISASTDPDLQLNPDFVNAAIERGDLAFGAFDEELLVSYIWRTVTTAPHTSDLWVRVDQPYCYSYKSYTRPSHRGKRISPAVHLFSDSEMLKRGYKWRAGFVAVENSASLAMGKHMGSNIVGYAGYIHWFGRYFFFRSRAARDVGFRFFENA